MTSDTPTQPEFVTLEEAAAMTTGTRVTFIPGIPALWAEALKNICYVKGVPLIRALHPMMGIDKETGKDRQARLYELTSQTSLPTMFHDSERPRNVWLEQLGLAEKIGAADAPRLVPKDFKQRVEVIGLCEIVLGEDGMVWNMRILADSPLAQKYGYSEEANGQAAEKVAAVIRLLDEKLASQEAKGSPYLVGESITAADVYWATMSMSVMPPSTDIMPVTKQNKGMLKYFRINGQIPVVAEALSPRIEKHQRYILTNYCETPAVLGGDPLDED